ncbi:MAG TPA: response regulator transcription factor [Thermoanaerobaculia bacterium]|nr:response regulator transcription factor [Thermoanaerobaculia bacterium]
MIRVLIADDHIIVREGLKMVLSWAGMEVIGEAETGHDAIELAKKTRPDVVLLDVSMPEGGGLETSKELKRLLPRTKVLMLTAHPEDHFAVRCLKEGADGYLTKMSPSEVVVAAIRKVHAGGKYVSPALAEKLAMSLQTGLGEAPHESLSHRELEVMRALASGKTATEMAGELHLSVKTVSTYRSRILEKMSMRSTAEIIRYALETGLAF